MYDWKENINTIKEIYPGHYQIILDFATIKFLKYIVNSKYSYVWVLDCRPLKSTAFELHNLPLFSGISTKVLARKLHFDFVMPTVEAIANLDRFDPGISLIQLNFIPKIYVDKSTMHERTFYDKLRVECDYLFHIDLPSATDYGRLISPNKGFLQRLLDDPEIDWNNLPL